MKAFYCLLLIVFTAMQVCAQVPYNSAAPNGYTRKASVSEQVGLTEVTITYHRPAVKGREGKIWGQTVHRGFADQGFGTSKSAPWRAGANENTIVEFDHDVKIEGRDLAKGKYGFFIAYDPDESILIFSKRTDAWGSFFYDEREDALRVKVKPRATERSVETLKYEFTEQTINSAVVSLSWEKLSIPFKIEVDHLKQQFQAFVTAAQHPSGFTAQSLNVAAGWALTNNYELEKALEWATLATGENFPGNPSYFPGLLTRIGLLKKLGKKEEAEAVAVKAIAVAPNEKAKQSVQRLIEK